MALFLTYHLFLFPCFREIFRRLSPQPSRTYFGLGRVYSYRVGLELVFIFA